MELDETDWRILELLQEDARLSLSEIGRKVNLSQPSVAERVKRLESSGVIRGYHAAVDTSQLGLPIEALIHFRADGLNSFCVKEQLESMAEVVDAWSVTGDDCLILHIVMPSVAAIEEFLLRLRHHGSTSTAIVLSTPIARRTIRRQRLLPAKFRNAQKSTNLQEHSSNESITESIRQILVRNHIPHTIHEHASARTVADAQESTNFPVEKMLKTVVFKAKQGPYILAGVCARDGVDYKLLAKATGFRRDALVCPEPEEMRNALGFEPSAVSPIHPSPDVQVFVDTHAAQSLDQLFCGIGRADRTLEIRMIDLLRVNHAKVAPLIKEQSIYHEG